MPCRNISLKARSDRRFIRATYRSNRFILAEITAPHAHVDPGTERRRPPVNLAFVLDRSGSMTGDKLRLAKLAVEGSLARLGSDDRFSIVVYDDRVDTVFESTKASAEARRAALSALEGITARGSTDLAGGWLRGCEQVALHLDAAGVNRALLLTDGLANVGITGVDELTSHAAQLRARGVSTTTFGVGADFDEHLLQQIATAGGGNFYYIADAASITDYVTSEVGEALDVVARDVALKIAAPESVVVESLSPFPFETRTGRTVVALGALVAEQVVQVVLRLNFPLGDLGRETGVVLSLSDRDAVAAEESVSIGWQYADSKTNDMQERDVEVDRAVARVFAAVARQEASQLNRRGDYPAAQAALAAVAKRIRGYAGRDPEMHGVIAQLESDATTLAAPMAPAAAKQMYFASYTQARMRAPDGKAMRGKPQ